MEEEIQTRYALINNNIVDNVIICNVPENLEFFRSRYDHIELLDTENERKLCCPGAYWDSANGIFILPSPDPVYTIPREEFRNRFTKEEKTALYTEAKTDIEVQMFLDDINATEFVDVSNQDTIDSVNNLATVGVIIQSRVEEILKPN